MHRSITPHLSATPSLALQARTVTANGATVDRKNADVAGFEIILGAWTDGTHTIKFQHLVDDTTWTDITAAQLDDPDGFLATGTATVVISDNTRAGARMFFGVTTNPYNNLRAVTTISGGPSTGAIYGVDVVTDPRDRSIGMNPMATSAFNAIP